MILGIVLAAAVSYLLGSIPTGYIVVKLIAKTDIRKVGSGNIGATNVKRVLGMKWFLAVLAADAFKGFLPVYIFQSVYGGSHPIIPVIAGVCAMLGHTYTVFLDFKGGKGVATGLGVFLGLAPLSMMTSLAVFIAVLLVFGYVSLGSITAAALLPAFVFIYAEGGYMGFVLLFAVAGAAFVIYKHKDNITRLLQGTENKFSASSTAAQVTGSGQPAKTERKKK